MAYGDIRHEITVARLHELLGELHADDLLVPNAVGNLAIVRGGVYVGFVDLLVDRSHVELSDDDGTPQ